MEKSISKTVTSPWWRPLYLGLGVFAFLVAYYIGASHTLTVDEAKEELYQIRNKQKDLDQEAIFVNNIKPALGMFIPGFGIGLGAYSAYSTGIVISAVATLNPFYNGVMLLRPIATAFGLMELVIYGLAISRSGLLTYILIKRRKPYIDYIIPTAIEVTIVISVLAIAAIIEGSAIESHQR